MINEKELIKIGFKKTYYNPDNKKEGYYLCYDITRNLAILSEETDNYSTAIIFDIPELKYTDIDQVKRFIDIIKQGLNK